MNKVLVFKVQFGEFARKTMVWDVSDKYSRDNAYIQLFSIVDNNFDTFEPADSVVCALLSLARSGNPEACEALLVYKRVSLNESFEEVEVKSPAAVKKQAEDFTVLLTTPKQIKEEK